MSVPKAIRVATCVAGIYVCFLTQGLIQEAVYATDVGGRKFRCPLFLVSVICLASGVLGLALTSASSTPRVWRALWGERSVMSRDLVRQGALTSVSYVGAMACTNFALTQVNYPTQVLVKSAKAVPVVLGGWLMYGKKYPVIDYVMVAVVTGSLVVFQLSTMKSNVNASRSIAGYLALFMSLSFDGMTGPRQDRLVAQYKLDTGEMMLLINAFAFPLCLCLSILIEGLEPWQILSSQFTTFLPKIFMLVICGAVGQVFVLQVLKDLGSLQLTLITTSRKFLTILLSVLWFAHPLTLIQWSAVVTLFTAVVSKYFVSRKTQKTT